jgi:hypothetical protein
MNFEICFASQGLLKNIADVQLDLLCCIWEERASNAELKASNLA